MGAAVLRAQPSEAAKDEQDMNAYGLETMGEMAPMSSWKHSSPRHVTWLAGCNRRGFPWMFVGVIYMAFLDLSPAHDGLLGNGNDVPPNLRTCLDRWPPPSDGRHSTDNTIQGLSFMRQCLYFLKTESDTIT